MKMRVRLFRNYYRSYAMLSIEYRLNVKRVLDLPNLTQIQTDLANHCHNTGLGRHPINPLSMPKVQLTKHLLNIISDRRLALRFKHDYKVARACGFRSSTLSHDSSPSSDTDSAKKPTSGIFN